MPWLSAFVLTQLVEAPLFAHALRDRPVGPRAALALLPSTLTHPILWFVLFPPLRHALGYVGAVLVGELVVVVTEGVVLTSFLAGRDRLLRAFATSLLANVLSTTVGLTSRALFGWP